MSTSPSIVAAFRGAAHTLPFQLPRSSRAARLSTRLPVPHRAPSPAGNSLILLLSIAALAPAATAAAATATPRAQSLTAETTNANETTFVVAEPLGNTITPIGFYITCKRSPRMLEAGFSFGAFPSRKAVQAAIRTPAGHIERFGRVVTGTPASGFHSPVVTDPDDIRRFLQTAFQHGSLISNGHNSIWNDLDEPTNTRVRTSVAACLKSP